MTKRRKPPTLYLLSYDNGQQWEDHHVSPLFVVATRARAEAIVIEVAEWVAAKRAKLPPCPYETTCERVEADQPEPTAEEYTAMHDKRQAQIAAVKPPHGITNVREMLTTGHGSLVIRELPFHP